MAVSQTHIASSKQVVAIPFQAVNIADAVGTLATINADNTAYVAPRPGSIVGLSGKINGTLTTGTLTFQVMINGTPATEWSTPSIHSSGTTYNKTQEGRKAGYTFEAGDEIAVLIKKAGTVLPTSRDGAFLLTVLLEEINL